MFVAKGLGVVLYLMKLSIGLAPEQASLVTYERIRHSGNSRMLRISKRQERRGKSSTARRVSLLPADAIFTFDVNGDKKMVTVTRAITVT